MRTTTIAMAVLMLLATWCPADVVYLKNGKKYEGKATRKDDKVVIELKMGTMEVPAEDVLAIEVRELPPDEPASKPAAPDGLPPAPDQPVAIGTAPLRVNPEMFVMPESHVFLAMRSRLSAPGMLESRAQIEKWQAMAHDRKRRVGEWVGPAEFTRRRANFQVILKDAEAQFQKAVVTVTRPNTLAYSGTGAGQQQAAAQALARYEKAVNDQRHAEAAGIEKIQQAAQAWADPLLRSFLQGMALYRGKAYESAQDAFRKCCQAAPRVAAFHQGLSMALPHAHRDLDALAECLQVLHLNPDSPDAVELVRAAMKAIPGADTKRDLYLQAQREMRDYENARSPVSTAGRLKTVTWLLPGKPTAVSKDSLPLLPYDRLVFRQAVAVPIAPHTLLVDRVPLEGQLEIFVRIDDKTIVPARLKQSGMTGYGSSAAPALAMLTVEECTFTPLETDEKLVPKGGTGVIPSTPWTGIRSTTTAPAIPTGAIPAIRTTTAPAIRRPAIPTAWNTKPATKETKAPPVKETAKETNEAAPPSPASAPTVKKDLPPPAGLAKGDSVTFYGLALFEEMGSTLRKVGTKVASASAEGTTLDDLLAPGEVGSPLIAGNKLVGFYLGKTDATVENGGADKILTAAELAPYLKQVRMGTASYSPGFGASAKPKRTNTAKDVAGQVFLIHITAGEVLK